MSLLAIVGFEPTIVQASGIDSQSVIDSTDSCYSVVQVWNKTYDENWELYGDSGVDSDLEMNWYSSDFSHSAPNVSIDVMFFPTSGYFASDGDSLSVDFRIGIVSGHLGGADSSKFDSVLVYLLYENEEEFGSAYGVAEYSGSTDVRMSVDIPTVSANVVGVMFRIYAESNSMWENGSLLDSYDYVCLYTPWIYEISSVEHIVIDNADDYYEEQIQLTNDIFANIKIIASYIMGLPSRIVSGLGEWFQNVIDSVGDFVSSLGNRISGFFTTLSSNISGYFTNLGNNIGGFFTTLSNNIGGYFTNLGNQIGGYFNNLARDIAIAVAEVFGWDDYQEGDSGVNDIFDKIVGSLPDLSAYVPRPGTLLGDVFNILFSNDTVAVFLKIVTVVGVGSFLIFK